MFFSTKFAVSFNVLKTYLRLRIKIDKTLPIWLSIFYYQKSKFKGKQTHFCEINSRFVGSELGAWCDKKLLILFLPIVFQNITIKLWMWPLTNDLILKDPISSSKSTEKDWKKVELVSEELNHYGLIAGLFRQISRGHTGWFVLFALFEYFSLK